MVTYPFPFCKGFSDAWKKRKPFRAFFFRLVTLFSGPRHAGNGQDSRHGVDTHARIEGLGAAALGIILGSRGGGVVIVARRSGLLFSRTHSISTIIILIKFAAIRRNHCTSDTTQAAVSCGILQGHRLAAVDFHRLLALKDNFLTVEVDSNIIAYSLVRLSLQMLFTGQAGLRDLSGPVGIVSTMVQVGEQAETTQAAVENIAYIAALIAVNLAVMNLLPLPALDGGRIFFLIINAATMLLFRKQIPAKYENYIHFAGLILLLALMVVLVFSDVGKLIH